MMRMMNLRLARLPAVLGARRCSSCGPGDNSLIVIIVIIFIIIVIIIIIIVIMIIVTISSMIDHQLVV